ncbi:Uncharacterized protein ACO02O_10314 [Dirofilaria immitis]
MNYYTTIRIIFTIIVITLLQIHRIHGSTTKIARNERRIQLRMNNNNAAVNFRIPEYFDLKGEKLNTLMIMLKERTNLLHENELKRNEIHKRYFWILGTILPAYMIASIIWIIANIIVYKRQKQKLENGNKANIFNQTQERERLLERYNQIPSVSNLPFNNNYSSSSPMEELNDCNNLNDISIHSTFEANRARVEAILKRNNEPQFMRRI